MPADAVAAAGKAISSARWAATTNASAGMRCRFTATCSWIAASLSAPARGLNGALAAAARRGQLTKRRWLVQSLRTLLRRSASHAPRATRAFEAVVSLLPSLDRDEQRQVLARLEALLRAHRPSACPCES